MESQHIILAPIPGAGGYAVWKNPNHMVRLSTDQQIFTQLIACDILCSPVSSNFLYGVWVKFQGLLMQRFHVLPVSVWFFSPLPAQVSLIQVCVVSARCPIPATDRWGCFPASHLKHWAASRFSHLVLQSTYIYAIASAVAGWAGMHCGIVAVLSPPNSCLFYKW